MTKTQNVTQKKNASPKISHQIHLAVKFGIKYLVTLSCDNFIYRHVKYQNYTYLYIVYHFIGNKSIYFYYIFCCFCRYGKN